VKYAWFECQTDGECNLSVSISVAFWVAEIKYR
jgi:hypothetical protein